MATRTALREFSLANPLYAGGTVSFYTVSGGVRTSTYATLYAASSGSTALSNPQTLDSTGKSAQPIYVEEAVVAVVSGLTIDSHETGVINDSLIIDLFDQFDDRYLGAKASDPTVDNDGNTLIAGAMYFNSTNSVMRVRTSGGTWIDAAVSEPVNVYVQSFSGDGATTVFTMTVPPTSANTLHVTISGVEQVPTTDYTISGSSLTFTSAPPAGSNNIFTRQYTPIGVAASPADETTIADTGNYFTGTSVEAALQEIGADLDGLTAASVDLVDAGGYYAGTNVEAALQEAAQASTTRLVDSGGYFTGTDVETAMQEVGDSIAQLNDADVITTQGDLILGNAAGEPVRLPIGSSGYRFRSNGTTGAWFASGYGGCMYRNTTQGIAATTWTPLVCNTGTAYENVECLSNPGGGTVITVPAGMTWMIPSAVAGFDNSDAAERDGVRGIRLRRLDVPGYTIPMCLSQLPPNTNAADTYTQLPTRRIPVSAGQTYRVEVYSTYAMNVEYSDISVEFE